MKKPEKKYCCIPTNTSVNNMKHAECLGYNQSCDDHDAWLPDEDEIAVIITKFFDRDNSAIRFGISKSSKAIAKRLGK